MKAILIVSLLAIPFCSNAQKQAIVYSMPVYGKVSQVEKTNYDYYLNSKKEVYLSAGFTKDIFYFDENQVLVKQQYLIDNSALDPTRKTKPKLSEVPVEPVKVDKNAIPVSVEPAGSLLENTYIYTYPNGSKKMVGKRTAPPYFILIAYINAEGKMMKKDQYNKDSVLMFSVRFYDNGDTMSLWQYDSRGNEDSYIPFEKNVREHISHKFEYAYDKRGNVIKKKQYEWNVELKAWQAKYAWEYKYTYMKDQTGAVIAPAPAKSVEEELAAAQRENDGDGGADTKNTTDKEDSKEKKSLKDRLNPFKKKD